MDAKAVKRANKQIKKAESDQLRKLKDAQKAEIKFLTAEGASKEEIKAEKAANSAESREAKSLLSANGFQVVPQKAENGFILSNVATYGDTYGPAVQNKIGQAIGLLSEYAIPQAATQKKDDAKITTGMSLNNAYALAAARESGQPITTELLKSDFSDYITGAGRQAKIFNAVDDFKNNPNITAVDFEKKLKPVKGQENVFTTKIGGGTTGAFQYDPATDSYKYLSATPVKVSQSGGGFLSSPLGSLLIGIGGGLLVPGLGGLLATGTWGGLAGTGATLASSLAAGGLIGAGSAAITGQNILGGALLGAAGGGAGFGIGQAGGLGNVVRNAGVGISDDLVKTLNSLVTGFGAPTPESAQLAADVLTANGIQTTADDVITAATIPLDDIVAPPGTLLDDVLSRPGAAFDDLVAPPVSVVDDVFTPGGGAGFNLNANQLEGFIPTPTGGGTLPAIPTPVPGSTGGIGFNPNAPGIGFNIDAESFIPTPVGGGTLPRPSGVNTNIDQFIPPPVGISQYPELFDEPLRPPEKGLLDKVKDAVDDIGLKEILGGAALLGALGGGGGGGIGTGGGGGGSGGRGGPLPSWVTDMGQSRVPANIALAQRPIPRFDVDFSNQFQRGGLGAGQYLGYGLLDQTGNIPMQTLLGVNPLALNYSGAPIGQTGMGQASLV